MKNKKECKDLEMLLTGYCDGELSTRDVLKVENHLKGCPDCSAQLQKNKKIRGMIREIIQKEVSKKDFTGFPERIQSRLGSKRSVSDSRLSLAWRSPLWSSGIAVGALAASLVLIFWFKPWETNQMRISKPSLELGLVLGEKGRLQNEIGAKIRNYAILQFFLRKREEAYQERLSTLRNVSFHYSDQGVFQEDLGRTIRDQAFIRFYAKRLGGMQQETIGKGIRDAAKLKFLEGPIT